MPHKRASLRKDDGLRGVELRFGRRPGGKCDSFLCDRNGRDPEDIAVSQLNSDNVSGIFPMTRSLDDLNQRIFHPRALSPPRRMTAAAATIANNAPAPISPAVPHASAGPIASDSCDIPGAAWLRLRRSCPSTSLPIAKQQAPTLRLPLTAPVDAEQPLSS